MYGILLSALYMALRFVVQSVLVKFVTFFALFFVVSGFISLLSNLMPSATSISPAFSGISSDIWYFLDLFAFSTGLPMILSAFVTRFIIRRIPVIG